MPDCLGAWDDEVNQRIKEGTSMGISTGPPGNVKGGEWYISEQPKKTKKPKAYARVVSKVNRDGDPYWEVQTRVFLFFWWRWDGYDCNSKALAIRAMNDLQALAGHPGHERPPSSR